MQANFAQDLMESHALLCNLERELGKERDGIVQTYTRNRTLYGSYFPMLEHYRDLEDQYVVALSKFRELLQATIPIPDNNRNMVTTANVSEVNMTRKIATNPVNVNNNNVNNNNNNVNGNYPVNNVNTVNNNNNNGNINNIAVDDGKQQEISTSPPQPQTQRVADIQQSQQPQPPPPQQQQQPPPPQQQASSPQVESEEMKVSALYHNNELSQRAPTKPPVKSSNVSSLPPVIDTQHTQNIQHSQPPQQQETVTVTAMNQGHNPMAIPIKHPVRSRKRLHVSRHKYKYEGRGFDIWRRNLQRPIYTATTLRINKKFRGDEKLVRKFLYEKGGFKPELIEQVTFIKKRGEDKNGKSTPKGQRGQKLQVGQIEFTIVRVRASLKYIYQRIDKIEQDVGENVIKKQNNRSRPNENAKSKKLYVNNFDIENKNTHINLTKIFLKYGDLEQDIFIGRDRGQNPYAIVEYREVSDAARCVNAHSNYQSTIFFPQISVKQLNDGTGGDENRRFLNRRLHIGYMSNDANNNSNNNNNRGSRRGRGGRGRGSRR